jgi:hypothetical protein
MRFVAEVRTNGDGLSAFAGTAFSAAGLGSVTGATVSIFAVRWGAKKFFVATFASGSVAFLGVRAASLVECRFLL